MLWFGHIKNLMFYMLLYMQKNVNFMFSVLCKITLIEIRRILRSVFFDLYVHSLTSFYYNEFHIWVLFYRLAFWITNQKPAFLKHCIIINCTERFDAHSNNSFRYFPTYLLYFAFVSESTKIIVVLNDIGKSC